MADYRTPQAQCPACGALMDTRAAADVMVDVCPACAALWIDWFDGAPPAVAAATGALPPSDVPAPEVVGACPRCTKPLEGEWLSETVKVHRCGECAGLLVPRASFDELVRLASAPDAPPAEPTALDRFVAILRDALRMLSLG